MSETTARLKLPFIAAAQAQKHVTHNEALLALDAIIHATVEDRDLAAPPAAPQEGQAWLVADSASGAWAGHEGEMAVWSDGVWRFHAPNAGWIALVRDENRLIVYNGALWRDFGEMLGALANLDKLGVNTTADDANRLAAKSDAILFSHDDVTPGSGDIRVKLNKKQSGKTASFLFQDNWSGRAEIGLSGGNDLRVKVSDDGTAFRDALIVRNDDGHVDFPHGFDLGRHLPASVTITGDADWWGPADHTTLGYDYASYLPLTANRLYFASLYVPRPLWLLGAFISLFKESSASGAVLRCGLYELGQPAGNSWNIGARIADFGVQPADTPGNKVFDLAAPLAVQPGWYVTVLGASGADARASYGKWLTPGSQRIFPNGTGSAARPRCGGHSLYLYRNNCQQEITDGLSDPFTANPISQVSTTVGWTYQAVFPKWRQMP